MQKRPRRSHEFWFRWQLTTRREICSRWSRAIRQFAPECSILVIDDNSPDGTGKIADELASRLPDVHVIHRAGKLGLGTAMLEAIKFAVQNQL